MLGVSALPHGVHFDVPEEQYHRKVLGLASKHALDLVLKAPAAYRAWVGGMEDEPTPAMQFGSAFHAAVLEAEKYKPGKMSTAKGRDDHAKIAGMVAAVKAHPIAGPLLAHGKPEVTIRWKSPEGLECKARIDSLSVGLAAASDLKSCVDASADEFGKSVARYGYDMQAAMYLEGLHCVGVEIPDFVFLAVEKSPPYLVGAYRLDEDWLARGSRRLRRAMRTLAECLATDKWPGLSSGITTLSPPRWASED
jgi:hypothetical protein